MRNSILQFAKQFTFVPQIENKEGLSNAITSYWVCGMGGSHLAADILRSWHPGLPVRIHSDYGLPIARKSSLLIFSSYSGNTEEIIDGLNKAVESGLDSAVIASGGELLDIAKRNSLPFVQLPPEDIQPRMALGYSLRAILTLMSEEQLLKETDALAESLASPGTGQYLASQGPALRIWEVQGIEMADRLAGRVPIIYASQANRAVAQIWKIKLNETAKIPAFYNMLPEANHNEIEGLDLNDKSAILAKNMYFILINDSEDHPRVQKRMEVLERLLKDRGLNLCAISMTGGTRLERMFNSILLADWTSLYLAQYYEVDPEPVRMVEEFKKLIK